jgi:hypothetical protein
MSNLMADRLSSAAILCLLFFFPILVQTGCSDSAPLSVNQGGGSNPGNPVGANLSQISVDPFTTGPGQHATEVEPHMFANGSTLVAAFQTGRISPGGATDIGWATSADGGKTWTHGFLPGLTTGEGSGFYDAASDPAVAYDAKDGVWMIASLPLSATLHAPAVAVSRSTDGGMTWQNPVSVDTGAPSSDKNWIVCDSWPGSPHYGNCYVEWDDPSSGDEIFMNASSDGGLTWGASTPTANAATGIGGQPLVQPNGNVIVPIEVFVTQNTATMSAFSSSDGGATWTAPVNISNIQFHADPGGIRSGPLPSAAIDGAGTVWVVWEDCRFRGTTCVDNDLVYSTSTDGVNWTAATRIPIDDVTSTVDHFIPGIGIDPATAGASAHVALHYYYYAQNSCDVSTCQLFVGYISSANGGTTWSTPAPLTGEMLLNWLPQSQNGLMVGDYIATAFTNGVPHGVFAVAQAKSGSTFAEAIYTGQGLTVSAAGHQRSSLADKPRHNLSDKIEKEVPEKGVPPLRRRARMRAK